MKRRSIQELRDLIFADALTEEEILALKDDSRKGVQKLLRHREQKQKEQKRLQEKYIQMQYFERQLQQSGCQYIAGIDEAGRGPLAGPVVAAAVILPSESELIGLNDSKLLSEAMRNRLYIQIKEQALSYGISVVNSDIIDQINIFEATKSAMRQSIGKLDIKPDHVLVDAVELHPLPCPMNAIIKGDQRSISIAAASILAKVTRDTIMARLHDEVPEYDFLSNKGYPTKQHLETLRKKGATVYHRKTFAPVSNSIS